jgi:hypothetical protein
MTALFSRINAKAGHPQLSPQLRNIAENQIDCAQPNRLQSCGLKKVVELRLRTFKI